MIFHSVAFFLYSSFFCCFLGFIVLYGGTIQAVVKDQNAIILFDNPPADFVQNMDAVKEPNAGFGEDPAPIPDDPGMPMLWLSLIVPAAGDALLLKRRAAR